MNKQREALELARAATPHDQLIAELLDSRIPKTEREHAAAREIKRLREALAEPEQKSACFKCGHAWHPDECVNTAPPARKSLTDEEIDNLELPPNGCTMRELVRAIERAHGISE